MIVYKVCTISGTSFLPLLWGMNRYHYDIGYTTVPLNGWGPLCAFADYKTAYGYVRAIPYYAIFECEAVESEEEIVYSPGGGDIHKNHLLNGTVLCSSITPIRRM